MEVLDRRPSKSTSLIATLRKNYTLLMLVSKVVQRTITIFSRFSEGTGHINPLDNTILLAFTRSYRKQ